jgi:hypothetical protein
MTIFITLLENVNKSRTSANNLSSKGAELLVERSENMQYQNFLGNFWTTTYNGAIQVLWKAQRIITTLCLK